MSRSIKATDAFENFSYSYNRLDALYMQVFEEDINFTQKMKDLVAEMLVIQVVAAAEAYELELTRFLVGKSVISLAKTKKAKDIAIKLFAVTKAADWSEVHEEIIETATRVITDAHSFDQWLKAWLPNNLAISIKAEAADQSILEEILATRNLLIHHRGIVNSTYCNRCKAYFTHMGNSAPAVGSSRTIEPKYSLSAMQYFQRTIRQIDSQIVKTL